MASDQNQILVLVLTIANINIFFAFLKIIDVLEQMQKDAAASIIAGNDALLLSLFRGDLSMNERKVNDDPSLRVAINNCVQAKCDVLIACQPVISDGRLGIMQYLCNAHRGTYYVLQIASL